MTVIVFDEEDEEGRGVLGVGESQVTLLDSGE